MALLNSIQSNTRTNILIGATLFALANMLFHIVPTTAFVLLLLVAQILFVDARDNAVTFMTLGGAVGAIFATQGTRFVGAFLMIIGFIYLLRDYQKVFDRLLPSLLILSIVIVTLWISVITTTGGYRAETKLSGTIVNALSRLFIYGHILYYRDKHNGTHLGYLFLCYAIIELMYMNEIYGLQGNLMSLFGFGGYRASFGEYFEGVQQDDVFTFNYQTIGLMICTGFALFYLDDTVNRNKWNKYIVWILTILLTLYTGSRQSFYALVAIIALFFMIYKKTSVSKISTIILLVLGFYILLFQLSSVSMDFILGRTEQELDSVRSLIRAEAFNDFKEHPLTGVGYGRFYFEGTYGVDEHNIIAEILAELGLVGSGVFAMVFVYVLMSNWTTLKKNKSELYPFIAIFVAILIRCMVSTSFIEGVLLFVLVSLLPGYSHYYVYKNK